MPGPKEHIDYVAVQPVKQVAPQASPNLLRLLVSSVTIRVQVYVDAQGKVMRAESLSHGNALVDYLSNISVKAAREWQFRPARQGDRDVEGEIVLQFEFEGNRKSKDGS
jgi:outer membrane biosynthesis protein TonB